MSGVRASYSNARDIDDTPEQEYRDRWGEDVDFQATEKLYADNLGKDLVDKVVLGQASEEETQQFEQLAREFGVSVQAIGKLIEEGDGARRASVDAKRDDRQATNVQSVDSSEGGRGTEDARKPRLSDDQLDQGYSLSDDGTLNRRLSVFSGHAYAKQSNLDSGHRLFYELVNKCFELAKAKSTEGQEPFELAQRYNDNLNRLRNILEKDYPIQSVPSSAGMG